MLQVVRRHGVASPGAVQSGPKTISDFTRAISKVSRKERKIQTALVALAAANLFVVCGAISFFLLARK